MIEDIRDQKKNTGLAAVSQSLGKDKGYIYIYQRGIQHRLQWYTPTYKYKYPSLYCPLSLILNCPQIVIFLSFKIVGSNFCDH